MHVIVYLLISTPPLELSSPLPHPAAANDHLKSVSILVFTAGTKGGTDVRVAIIAVAVIVDLHCPVPLVFQLHHIPFQLQLLRQLSVHRLCIRLAKQALEDEWRPERIHELHHTGPLRTDYLL